MYIIYNVNTLYVVKKFETERGAKISLKRKYSKGHAGDELAVTDSDTFRNEIDYEVDTYNMLNPSAGTFKIMKSLQGTYMDPATESYHSM